MIPIETVVEYQERWLTAARQGGGIAGTAALQAFTGMCPAITILTRNLSRLGYPTVPGLLYPPPGMDARIRSVETTISGQIPPALRLFWRIVGGISLLDLKNYTHVDFWDARDISGPSGYCDGLHLDELCDDMLDYIQQDYEGYEEDKHINQDDYILPIGPDGYHKDDISGGPPYSMAINGDWLTPIDGFSWKGSQRPVSAPEQACDLVSYFRAAILECAGFPALLGHPDFEPIRIKLLEDVVPF